MKLVRTGLTAGGRGRDKERAELAQDFSQLEIKLDTAALERGKLAPPLVEEEKRHREAQEKLSDLKIENARLEECIAKTERRADDLRDQVTHLDG